MPYSVYLVEDEIVAREGIRDNVDWQANGFVFCGEAADGELALPQLETLKPDLLITDIRMPFMDGLQLCRLVRERLPQTKIVIISGYDEFSYAQQAIKLGVAEYLLKPISTQDVAAVLQRIAAQFDQERDDAQRRRQLEQQLRASRPLLQEHLLLELVLGETNMLDAIERSRQFDLDLLAPCYQVLLTRTVPTTDVASYSTFQAAETILTEVAQAWQNVLVCRKDREEIVFIVKAEDKSTLTEASASLAQALQQSVESRVPCRLTIGRGTIHARLGELPQSFRAANTAIALAEGRPPLDVTEAPPLPNQGVVETFLAVGAGQNVAQFVDEQIAPWRSTVERSPLMRNYLLLDIYLTAGRLVEEWGGELEDLFPELVDFAALSLTVNDYARFEAQYRHVLTATITYRNRAVDGHQMALMHQARTYIEANYAAPDISLGQAAAHVGLSPSHFSALFRRENGDSFKETLTQVRIQRAKELLRGSSLRSFEIAAEVGYTDPHYFSTVFKKETGLSPREFRNGR